MFKHYGTGVLNGSLWTIAVELEFYFVLPILHRFSKKSWFDVLLLSTILVSLAVFLFFPESNSLKSKLIHGSVIPYLWEFLLGVAIQRHFAKLRPFLEDKALFWIVPYIAVIYCTDRFIPGIYSRATACTLLAPLVISCAYSAKGISEKLLRGADISYGTYLYHMLWVNAILQMGFVGFGLPVAAVYALTIVSALASWFLIERKALSMKGKGSTFPKPPSDPEIRFDPEMQAGAK